MRIRRPFLIFQYLTGKVQTASASNNLRSFPGDPAPTVVHREVKTIPVRQSMRSALPPNLLPCHISADERPFSRWSPPAASWLAKKIHLRINFATQLSAKYFAEESTTPFSTPIPLRRPQLAKPRP